MCGLPLPERWPKIRIVFFLAECPAQRLLVPSGLHRWRHFRDRSCQPRSRRNADRGQGQRRNLRRRQAQEPVPRRLDQVWQHRGQDAEEHHQADDVIGSALDGSDTAPFPSPALSNPSSFRLFSNLKALMMFTFLRLSF